MASAGKLVHAFLETQAARRGSKTALVHGPVRRTYAEINCAANAVAGRLLDLGVQKGDRVVLLYENSFAYVASYYGILKAGGVVVSLSTGLKAEGIQPLVDELQPRACIASHRLAHELLRCRLHEHGVRGVLVSGDSDIGNPDTIQPESLDTLLESASREQNPGRNIEPDNLAAIIYTSGSTGRPKGVMLTHGNIVANTESICAYLQLTESDIQLVVLPFFYVMGKSLLNTHVAVGGRVVINNKFAFPAAVLKEMADEQVTGFSGVPSTFAYLLHRSPLAKYVDKLPNLRYVSQAGGHMPTQIKRELRAVLPSHTKIVVMYGATEASARLTWLDPAYFESKIESIGRAIPGVTMRVLKPDGSEAQPGETGELVGSGDNIMQGYWKNEEATAKVLDSNGYHTGDMGYCDEDGFLFVTGRRDNLLKVGGHRINPQDVEDVLMASELLVETAVVGMPDPILGNKLVALAVPRDKACAPDSVLRYASNNLPRYKLPERVLFTGKLPKTDNGKVNRAACRGVLEEEK